MRTLIVGSGKGSWEMRGQQLGAAISARVTSSPVAADFVWADVVVLVKRAAFRWADAVHRAGRPLVWDALDFWSQPAQNGWSEAQARALLEQQIATIRPALTIGATRAMAETAGGVYLPHHGWTGLQPTPARETVQVVAYQGGEVFLSAWRPAIEQACRHRGWRFVVNPADLSTADIIVALRGGMWDGWMCREWKSGVKVVNAIRAGRPLITQEGAAVRELAPAGTVVASVDDLETAIDAWTPVDRRAAVVAASRAIASAFDLAAIADRYRALLAQVEAPCSA